MRIWRTTKQNADCKGAKSSNFRVPNKFAVARDWSAKALAVMESNQKYVNPGQNQPSMRIEASQATAKCTCTSKSTNRAYIAKCCVITIEVNSQCQPTSALACSES